MRAADKAAQAFATRDAIALYDAAEAAGRRRGEGAPLEARMTIHRRRADLYALVSDFDRARAESESALRLAQQSGDRRVEGEALVAMGQASLLGHHFDQALEDSRRAAEIAEALGAPSILTGSPLNEAFVHEVTGRLTEARVKFDRALALSRQNSDGVNQATALVYGAELESWEGHYARAAKLYDEGIRRGRAHNILATLEGMFMSGVNFTGQGAYDRALAIFDEGLTLAGRVGDENDTPRYLNSIGWLYMECGDLDRARELSERAAVGGRNRGDHESFANAELNLGDIALVTGRPAPGSRVYRGRPSPRPGSGGQRVDALALLHAPVREPRRAGAHARRFRPRAGGRGRLSRTSHPDAVPEIHRDGLAAPRGAPLARRHWDDAEHALRQALSVAQSIDNPTQLWKTHATLARLDAERQRPDRAREAWQAARKVMDRLRDNLRHPGLRNSFSSSPIIRQAFESGPPSSSSHRNGAYAGAKMLVGVSELGASLAAGRGPSKAASRCSVGSTRSANRRRFSWASSCGIPP